MALAALVGLWLLTWLAAPLLAKGPLERLASDKLGRTVTVGAIDFQPWSLELALRDVAVAGAGGSPAQLTVGRIYVDGELQSLLRLAPVVDAVAVETPVLRITHRGDGHYDVDDIIARLTAPPETPKPDTAPARMALYNLTLTGGRIDFIDESVNKTHEVRGLDFKLPFISTLPSQREVKVEPHLSFALDGSRFDSSAEGTPFAKAGKGDAQIRLDGLNLAPYLAYLPAELPIRVTGAVADVDVKLAFEQHPRMAVKLTGTVQARDVAITDRQGNALLSYERLKIDMADVRPLDRVVRLAQVELTRPVLTAARDAQGQLNLAQLAQPTASAPAPAAPAKRTASSVKGQPASATPWLIEVSHTVVHSGTVRFSDQTTQPAADLLATDVTLDATGLVLPFASKDAQPVAFKGGLNVQGSALNFVGEATDQKAQVTATLNALALQLAAPYLAQTLEPVISGDITGDIGVLWQAPTPQAAKAGATGVTVTAGPLAIDKLVMKQGKTTVASLDKLEVAGVVVPLDSRTATLERVAINQPQATVERGADGRWMFERWMKAATRTKEAPGSITGADNDRNSAPWKLHVADFSLQGGAVSFADKAQARPVAVELSALAITARNLASDGSKPEAFQLSTNAAAPGKGNRVGRLAYIGTLALQPLAAQGKLDATRLPLHTLEGYGANQLSLELLRAEVGYRGQVAVTQTDQGAHPGTSLRLAGDAVIEEFKANSTAASTPKTEAQVGEELLAWKSLNLRGLSVATAPNTAPRVEVKETSLVDFFARVTINESGRINLSDLAKTPAEASAANAKSKALGTAQAVAAAPTPTPTSTSTSTSTSTASAASAPATATSSTATSSTASSPTAVAKADPLAPVVVFGPVSLVNGKVLFSDFFIKPNYSADLTELTGKLSAFSSAAPGGEAVLANLELRGRAEGSASLEVSGQLNPLAKPLALDITGKVRDLELPPLSPYAVKYVGHGIERGKLSMDVNYKVLPSGQLTASNRLTLNQLTFGEAVEGAPNSLPVKLAVALLADRNGVIDLDLPIRGSLNDPQFSIGPVIFKVIVNLIGKALTAPFSLLANAFGGGDEMSSVPFAPGSAALAPEAQRNLAKVVKALSDRPALKITVTGMASLQAEREGLQRAYLQQLALAEKHRTRPQTDTAEAAESTDAAQATELTVTAAEYPALLKAAYGRANMPKPRNLVGMAKDLSVPEMEALLLAQRPATEAMAAELATQRGQAVRAYLLSQKLPAERLFVAAPKSGKQTEKWEPHAEMSLSTQ